MTTCRYPNCHPPPPPLMCADFCYPPAPHPLAEFNDWTLADFERELGFDLPDPPMPVITPKPRKTPKIRRP